MELKAGYKRTEVGVIPEDWDVKSIADIGQIKTGPFGTLLKASEYSGYEGVPLISVGEVGPGKFKIGAHTPRVPEAVTRRLPQYVLRNGDIVFGRKGSVDRSAMVTQAEDGWFLGSDGISIRPNAKCHPPYLAAQFQRHEVQSWLMQNAIGTTMASMNQGILSRVQIPYAPLSEQPGIATALSDVDALLAKIDQLIAKKRDLKQAAMQQLLTGQTRLPGFSGEWEVKHFAEIATLRRDRVDPKKAGGQEFCIELEHIEQGSGRLAGSTSTGDGSSLKSVFLPGDVLFGKLRAYLRKYWLADRSGVCSTEIWVLVANRCLMRPEYLLQTVTRSQFIVAASEAYGTHMPRSDWNVVKNYEVKIPPLAEQTAIATVLSDMDAELAALESRRDKTGLLKQGMMQALLTGRIRLPTEK